VILCPLLLVIYDLFLVETLLDCLLAVDNLSVVEYSLVRLYSDSCLVRLSKYKRKKD